MWLDQGSTERIVQTTAQSGDDEAHRLLRSQHATAGATGGTTSSSGLARKPDIAVTIGQHRDRDFGIDAQTRARHLYVLGQTGTGKTTFLANLIAQDMRTAGRGVAVFDPHGDLAQTALGLVPTHRAHELVYLDPSDLARPIGFNVLDNLAPDQHATAADGVVAAFIHVWGEQAVGSRSQQVLRNSLRALMSNPGMTLLAIPKLLTDENFRRRIVARVSDPVIAAYWRDQYEGYNERFRAEVTAPILNKLDPILSGHLRNIVSQPKSTIDIRKIMDEGRILIVNLSKGAIGEGQSHLLGALLITTIAAAALSRADQAPEQRRPFYLYTDEFQTYASDAFGLILSEARKYALVLTLAHQYLGQLSENLRQAVLGNVGSLLSLRIGAEDAHLISRHLGLGDPQPNPDALIELSNSTAWGKFLIDATPTEAMFLQLLPPPKPINHRPHRLITNSRVRFGRERASIEQKIHRFLGGH